MKHIDLVVSTLCFQIDELKAELSEERLRYENLSKQFDVLQEKYINEKYELNDYRGNNLIGGNS
jgi:hypothetical protein